MPFLEMRPAELSSMSLSQTLRKGRQQAGACVLTCDATTCRSASLAGEELKLRLKTDQSTQDDTTAPARLAFCTRLNPSQERPRDMEQNKKGCLS